MSLMEHSITDVKIHNWLAAEADKIALSVETSGILNL